MQAYEFQIVVKNGTISLLFAYLPLHSQKVRVIVLVDENPTQNIEAIIGLFAQAAFADYQELLTDLLTSNLDDFKNFEFADLKANKALLGIQAGRGSGQSGWYKVGILKLNWFVS